jgi:hypothetical protein
MLLGDNAGVFKEFPDKQESIDADREKNPRPSSGGMGKANRTKEHCMRESFELRFCLQSTVVRSSELVRVLSDSTGDSTNGSGADRFTVPRNDGGASWGEVDGHVYSG